MTIQKYITTVHICVYAIIKNLFLLLLFSFFIILFIRIEFQIQLKLLLRFKPMTNGCRSFWIYIFFEIIRFFVAILLQNFSEKCVIRKRFHLKAHTSNSKLCVFLCTVKINFIDILNVEYASHKQNLFCN